MEVERVVEVAEWSSQSHGDTEALAFLQLAIADVAAVESLSSDVRWVVPAAGAARSAYESAVTAAWMLEPLDLAERDRRWMAIFADEAAYWSRLVEAATERADPMAVVDALRAEVTRVDAIIREVQPQLDAVSAGAISRMPSIEQRLKDVGQERHYATYRSSCQLVHPASRALAQVRDLTEAHDNEAPMATYGFRTRPRDWTPTLLLAAEALAFGTMRMLAQSPPRTRVVNQVAQLFNDTVSSVRVILQSP